MLAATLPVVDYATNSIAKRIAGADPAVCLSRFRDYPPSKGKLGFPRCLFENPFPLNEKFWLKDVDFSCVSPWNDAHGRLRAGTVISKRHIVFAKHFQIAKGARILFADNEGGVCPVYIEETCPVESADLVVGLLNAEVTPNIHPAKILPANYAEYIGNGEGLPVITFNQHEQAFLSELRATDPNRRYCYVGSLVPKDANWARFRHPIIGGDSGDPAFILIGNEPIFIYTLSAGEAGGGPGIYYSRHRIQAAMDKLCPGYKLEEFDFESHQRPFSSTSRREQFPISQ